MGNIVRYGARAASALALAMAAGTGAGGVLATEASAAGHVQEYSTDQDGPPVQDGPSVSIEQYGVNGPWSAGAMTIQSHGYAGELHLAFRLDGPGKYTNLHFSTSEPGSAAGCRISTLAAMEPPYRHLGCHATLAPLKAGEKRTYQVTMTGERDGKSFTVSDSTIVWAPDVSIAVLRDGKDITGTKAPVTFASKMEMVVTNRSGAVLTGLSDFVDEGPRLCRIAAVPAGGSARCSFTFGRYDWGRGYFVNGTLEMWRLHVNVGDVYGFLRAPRTMLTLVDRIGEGGGATPTVAATASPTAPTTPGTGVKPPLADTGLPVGGTVTVSLGMVAAGAAGIVLSRRR